MNVSLGILACGVQGRSNLEALACLFEIEKVKAFDINPEKAENFTREMTATLEVEIEIVNNPKDAVMGLDLVVTSGPILKHPDPVIEVGWFDEGSFACTLDFDSYWQGDALRQADKLVTDDIGQMGYYRKAGYFKDTPQPYADLGEIVAGKKPGRENAKERIICINLGLALDDMATAILIYRKAREKGIGTQLPL